MNKKDLTRGLLDVGTNPTLLDEFKTDSKNILSKKPDDTTEEEILLMGVGYGFALATR